MNDEQPATPQPAEPSTRRLYGQVPPMPPTVNRRRIDREYLESAYDWANNNPGVLSWLADNHAAIREAIARSDAIPQQPAAASAGASADAMYRGKCPDGDRCVHGCHANERCHLGATKPGDDIRMSPQQFEWWQNQSAAWMAVADALQKHWSPAALSGGTNGTTSATGLIKMLCEEAKAYRAAGHRAALQSLPVATAQQSEPAPTPLTNPHNWFPALHAIVEVWADQNSYAPGALDKMIANASEEIVAWRTLYGQATAQQSEAASPLVYLPHHKVTINLREVESITSYGDYPDECTLKMRSGKRYSVGSGYRKTAAQSTEHWAALVTEAIRATPTPPVVAGEATERAGWKLVPIEPTEAMVDAGHEAIKEEHDRGNGQWGECGGTSWRESRAAWKAMLDAVSGEATERGRPS